MAKKQETPNSRDIIFEGVIIRSATLSNGDSRHAKIELTASWTEKIRAEMQWDELPECFGSTDLIGSYTASNARLTPYGLEKNAEEFPTDELNGFHVVPLKDKGGNVTGHELRFTLYTRHLQAIGRVARYLDKIGKGPGVLLVTEGEQQATIEDTQ